VEQVTLGITARTFFHGRLQSEKYGPVTNPAAGAGFKVTIGTEYYEAWAALTFLLTTSSHAANRAVVLQLLDEASNVVAAIPAGSTQAASLGYTYSFVAGVGNVNAVEGLAVVSPMFPMVIPSSYSLNVAITNVDTADQISKIFGYRDRFSTGTDGYPVGGFSFEQFPDLAERFALGNT
jgi:hypothetical protein